MKTILCIGYQIPGYSNCFEDFTSKKSLLETDIIVFSPNFHYEQQYGTYDGKPLLTEKASRVFREDSAHWRREIGICIDAGKTVFVFMNDYKPVSIYAERTSKSLYESYDNYRFLPLASFDVVSATGSKIKVVNPFFTSFCNAFKDNISYRVYIEAEHAEPIFETQSGNMILGACISYGKGHLILLPYLHYDRKKFTTVKGENAVWTEEAISWGKKLVSNLIEIDRSLNSGKTRTPAPEWVSDPQFILQPEIELESKISVTENQISKLKDKVNTLRKGLDDITELRGLLYENGKNLEIAVIKALKILGYEADGYNDGTLELDQVIISPEGIRFIGECEGKENSEIDISKFRQLADAIHEDLEKHETESEAIGLLFGNPFRLMAPLERKGDFTKKCKEGAKRRNYGLIKTTALFPVCKYILEANDKKFQKACRDAIENGLGGIITFPAIPMK